MNPETLASCLEALKQIAELDPADPAFVEVERAVGRFTKSAKQRRKRARRHETNAEDRAILASPAPDRALNHARMCAVCKSPYRVVDARYPHHCPACAAQDSSHRTARCDLRGRRALVTGGRIKIGYRLALKLLRDGADVTVTTRFPADATSRFHAEPDHAEWLERLHVEHLELKNLPGLLDWLAQSAPSQLDILVNNAAQTVWRPPAYYAAWLDQERALSGASPMAMITSRDDALFPIGRVDEEGLPLDLRPTNSWKAEAGDVPPVELAEVMVVNAIAPFLITTHLRNALKRSSFPDRYVVHASAVEGQFEVRNKTVRHPHTNMAKAALNMFTRTSAEDFARDGIHMTSVDTGWITNENPQADRERQRAHGFKAPLDAEDGASRLYDPILRGVSQQDYRSGVLFKDYLPTPW